jgi:hypothetical protein
MLAKEVRSETAKIECKMLWIEPSFFFQKNLVRLRVANNTYCPETAVSANLQTIFQHV